MGEIIRIAIRAAHLIAATAWIGGALFFAVALRPNVTREHTAMLAAVNRTYRTWVNVCIWTLAITGMFMLADRLTNARLGAVYLSIVVAKVGLALAAFYLALVLSEQAQHPGRKGRGRWASTTANGRDAGADRATRHGLRAPPLLILGFGVFVYVLGAALEVISRSLAG